MLKLYCVTGYKKHDEDPIINGHQTQEMILEEAKDIMQSDIVRLKRAVNLLELIVEKLFRDYTFGIN